MHFFVLQPHFRSILVILFDFSYNKLKLFLLKEGSGVRPAGFVNKGHISEVDPSFIGIMAEFFH